MTPRAGRRPGASPVQSHRGRTASRPGTTTPSPRSPSPGYLGIQGRRRAGALSGPLKGHVWRGRCRIGPNSPDSATSPGPPQGRSGAPGRDDQGPGGHVRPAPPGTAWLRRSPITSASCGLVRPAPRAAPVACKHGRPGAVRGIAATQRDGPASPASRRQLKRRPHHLRAPGAAVPGVVDRAAAIARRRGVSLASFTAAAFARLPTVRGPACRVSAGAFVASPGPTRTAAALADSRHRVRMRAASVRLRVVVAASVTIAGPPTRHRASSRNRHGRQRQGGFSSAAAALDNIGTARSALRCSSARKRQFQLLGAHLLRGVMRPCLSCAQRG